MPTLSLCIIVGKDEATELETCLKSVQGPLFEQIVVVTTQDDPEVKSVAETYATEVHHFDWVNDFSAARNFSFSHATTDFIMWLDADDEISSENYQKLLDLKGGLDSNDVVMLEYNYSHDAQGKPTLVLPRERIVRRSLNAKWVDPIHECLGLTSSMRILRKRDIAIDHRRKRAFNPERNLSISREIYERGEASPRLKFYYAKDMYEAGMHKEAVPVFEDYLNGPTDYDDNKAIACLKMAEYYKLNGQIEEHKSYLLKGKTFSNKYAEFTFFLGDIHYDKREFAEAIPYYEECVKMPMDAGFSMQAAFYNYLPYDRLSVCYFEIKEYKKSLECNLKTQEHKPDDPRLQANNRMILERLQAARLQSPSIAWMVEGFNPVDPVQRIRRLNVHKKLKEFDKASELITNYSEVPVEALMQVFDAKGTNSVVLTSFTEKERELARELKVKGIKVIYDIAEDILDLPNVAESLKLADLIICCSSALCSKAAKIAPSIYIPDAIEESYPSKEHDYFTERENPVALFIGMGGNSWLVKEHLKDVIEGQGYQLKLVTEWEDADEKWSMKDWPDQMNEADVILCPQRVDVQPAKSNVKVTQAMEFGIPVIASPLQAYKEVIDHGKNGFICDTKEEWSSALSILKDKKKRIQIGLNGQESVGNYRLDSVAHKVYESIRKFLSGELEVERSIDVSSAAAREPVSLIIPVYENLDYLKACLNSINMNTTYPYHVVISDAGSGDGVWDYLSTLKGYTVLGSKGKRLNFSEACNAGINSSRGKYFAIMNSDVIVTKGWLENIMHQMETVPRLAACGVLSNCDRYWLHDAEGKPSYPMMLEESGLDLVPGMKYDQVMPHIDELYKHGAKLNDQYKGQYTEQAWVAAYSTVYARSAFDEVGLFDPRFKNGHEDLDHCRRLVLKGYKIGQSIGSFVFHFGGISRGAYEKEDYAKYREEDKANQIIYDKKWSKKRVSIYTGPAWEKWNRDTVDKGMAGSETWASELGAELSRRGLKVTIYNDCPIDGEVDRDGVIYRHYSFYKEDVQYKAIDYTILSRTCDLVGRDTRSIRTDVMVHDVWVSGDPNYDMKPWGVSKYHCLSEWHKDFFAKHHKVPEDKISISANGVHPELYADVDSVKKKNKIFYSSSPDRGLMVLLELLPRIREEVPDLELAVAYGFHNWESAVRQRNDKQQMQHLERVKELMKQDGVVYLDRVDKKTLAKHQMESKAWLYPTWFSETFCITGVEAGLAKNAIVTTPYAGLLTTLGDAPVYVQGPKEVDVSQWCMTPQYRDEFVSSAIKILKDDEYRDSIASRVHEQVKKYTWQYVADLWMKEWGLM